MLDADAHVVEASGIFDEWMMPDELPARLPETTPMVPCGEIGLVADQLEHGFDPPSYLRAMDRQGIDGVVLYPSLGLFVPFLPELDPIESHAACRAYNEWIADYCRADPGRLAAVGIVPLYDPDRGADEAEYCARRGLAGVLVRPNHLYERNLGDRAYDSIYTVVERTDMVLAVHEGLGLRGPTIGSKRFSTFAERHAVSHPMEQMSAMTSLFLSGALDRHPRMRVAFLESGTGWLPYWLHRLDEHAEWMRDSETKGLELTPTEYFLRQCVVSTDPDDALAPLAVRHVGADHVVWASDFPHPDAVFPGAVEHFLEEIEEAPGATESPSGEAAGPPLTDDELAAIFWDTPARFYRLERRFGSA